MKKKFAFTLAEVLITLTIIGVIAALTIPNLMQKWKNQATITKLGKGYEAIKQMTYNIKENTQCDDVECTGLYNLSGANLQKKFVELAGIKDAKLVDMSGARITAKYLHCETQGCNNGNIYIGSYFIAQDGLLYSVYVSGDLCNNTDASGKALRIVLGTDKKKTAPTSNDSISYTSGRNLFSFVIYNNFKAEPAVSTIAGMLCPMSIAPREAIKKNCNPKESWGMSGTSCAARIITNGWKIDY